MSDIYIVAMPFGSVDWPSLGVGQLTAAAKQDGLDARATYPSLRFAEQIGYPLYKIIADFLHSAHLYGEWFFSQAAFEGFTIPQYETFLDTFVQDAALSKYICTTFGKDKNFLVNEFEKVQEKAASFVDQIAREILVDQPIIVGCSATFMQYNASLALLRKIKHHNPAIVTLLGGANCEAEMGWTTIKNFDWIDFVVSGEADTLFPGLCRKIFRCGVDIPEEELPYGVYSKDKFSATQQPPEHGCPEIAIEHDLNAIPVPDYHDYFQDLHKTSLKHTLTPALSMETSRGCWKGQKQPCNFCGLNGERIGYRTKSPKRVLQELECLSRQYGVNMFLMTDTILHMRYFKELLKELAQQHAPYKFFFETISTLSEDQVKLLADAGVVKIQPGIESLHDELLKLLNKGNSAIQNIALLKYALENGVSVSWNILFNIPGERDACYQEMAELLPLLYHLQPPNLVQLRFDRFSTYFEKSRHFGLTLVPGRSYAYIYPFTPENLATFACFFDDAARCDTSQHATSPGIQRVARLISQEWKEAFYHRSNEAPKATLSISKNDEDYTMISDTRPCAVAPEFRLTGIEHHIYKNCRRPITRSSLYQSVCRASQEILGDERIFNQGLSHLIEKKLLLQINGKYLALASFKPKREFTLPLQDLFLARFLQEQGTSPGSPADKIWEWFESFEIA